MMKRDNEYILDIILVILAGITIILSSVLWIDLKNTSPNRTTTVATETEYDTNEIFKQLLRPQKMVATYNGKHHHIGEFDEIYGTYQDRIYDIFARLNPAEAEMISVEQYLAMQNMPSIVFFYSSSVNLTLLLANLIEPEQYNHEIPISEIYFSRDAIVVSDGINYYKFNVAVNVDSTLSSLTGESLPEVKNLFELYGINKNIYISEDDNYTMRKVTYINDLKDLMFNEAYINNLTKRFLNQDIEHIRDIVQDESRNLIFSDEYLTLYTNGIIEYENLREVESKTRNLYTSYRSAMSFISSRVGSSGLYISEIQPIEIKDNKGYRFKFNLMEDYIPVAVNNPDHPNYIEIDVYNSGVKHFVLNYKKVEKDVPPKYEKISAVSLLDIIDNAPTVFNEPFEEVLNGIKDIEVVYLDNTANGQSELRSCMFIEYKGRKLYFSLESGRLLMER